jgi:hypothetical protein
MMRSDVIGWMGRGLELGLGENKRLYRIVVWPTYAMLLCCQVAPASTTTTCPCPFLGKNDRMLMFQNTYVLCCVTRVISLFLLSFCIP